MTDHASLVPPPNSLVIGDQDLLVFIDETGHEDITNSARLFGVGGIIVYGAAYAQAVEQPWKAIRTQLALLPDQPLHAASDFKLYNSALPQLANFFEQGAFVRHVSIVTPRTTSNFNPFITATCAGLVRNVGRALVSALKTVVVSRVVYILEHSERLHTEYAKLVGPTGPTLIGADGRRHVFPQFWGALRKSSCTPGLEVADFVLHAAQAQVRAKAENPQAKDRKDFHAVFRSVPSHFVEYMEINNAQSTPGEGPPGVWRIGLQ